MARLCIYHLQCGLHYKLNNNWTISNYFSIIYLIHLYNTKLHQYSKKVAAFLYLKRRKWLTCKLEKSVLNEVG